MSESLELYNIRKDGIYFQDKWMCSPLEIVANVTPQIIDGRILNARIIRFPDLDERLHLVNIELRNSKKFFRLLLSLGLRISTEKKMQKKFLEYLNNLENIQKRSYK